MVDRVNGRVALGSLEAVSVAVKAVARAAVRVEAKVAGRGVARLVVRVLGVGRQLQVGGLSGAGIGTGASAGNGAVFAITWLNWLLFTGSQENATLCIGATN